MPLEPEQRQNGDRRRVTRNGRRSSDPKPILRAPDACPVHGVAYSCVIDSRAKDGYRYRRHRCLECDARWNSYESLIDPRRIRLAQPAKTS